MRLEENTVKRKLLIYTAINPLFFPNRAPQAKTNLILCLDFIYVR